MGGCMPQLNLAIHCPRKATMSPCISIQRERGIGNVIQLNQLKWENISHRWFYMYVHLHSIALGTWLDMYTVYVQGHCVPIQLQPANHIVLYITLYYLTLYSMQCTCIEIYA